MTTLYQASFIKPKRIRRTADQMDGFRTDIWDIVFAGRPMSARQTYYRAVVPGLVEKDVKNSRANEQKVGGALNLMRENGIRYGIYDGLKADEADERLLLDTMARVGVEAAYRQLHILPFEWITDNTRTRFQADQFLSKDAAMEDLARLYRRDLWQRQLRRVEVWCESDSIAGVLQPVTDEFGVALLPCRGQSSKPFVFGSAQQYAMLSQPVTCLYVGDFDPCGLDIGESVRERLARYGAPDSCEFRRLAVEPGQVRDMNLVGHGLNTNIQAKVRDRFRAVCALYGIANEAVEAEAMDPNDMRRIVRDAIRAYIDARQWELELAVEKEERRDLRALLDAKAADAGVEGESADVE